MPAVACPITDCDYVTDDLDATIVAALITAHSAVHIPKREHAAKVNYPLLCACSVALYCMYTSFMQVN
ncbi:hypothetical protein KP79_PYT25481 [Mizuhopecten yessoensis]|uniref:Uncharacterized protein n=1 Tax=Mizuhopecten yessoensis TaxID=6573 RepID=A0A210QX48_MIZYE|nr:hypothetical protein KP79_PYT25481 [Mizuhopecten yessoensis]